MPWYGRFFLYDRAIMRKWLIAGASLLLTLIILAVGGLAGVIWYFSRHLPDYAQLADYQPATMTRLHAADGRLLAEYATEKRIFVPIVAIPELVKQAFIAAEDQNFYTHPGVDFMSVVRAAVQNLANLGANRRPVGASTITQQVAKNFLLTNEVSIDRKVKEAILAFRIEKALTKDRIFELYLNEIYLGGGAYGVASAAMNYFNKSLDQLQPHEAAYLAALPKAPSNYSPTQHNDRAKARRDWVLDRMREDGYLKADAAAAAQAEPLQTRKRDAEEIVVGGEYFAEEVRRELHARYGETGLYRGGLSVRTSMDPRLQAIADKVLRAGLISYDRRHGWRGPVANWPNAEGWQAKLAGHPNVPGQGKWLLAVVLKLDERQAEIALKGGGNGQIPMAELTWARPVLSDQNVGPVPRRPADALKIGDVILVEAMSEPDSGKGKYPAGTYGLRQIPDVAGALVAMDPHTGRVLAMTGGYSFDISQFNRAVQAQRQPGSSFKPFVYMAALDSGYTPASIVLDAPFVIDQGPGLGKWKPSNYSEKFYGPTPLRVGIEQSRNLMTVRLAEAVGMDKVSEYAAKFGIADKMPKQLSMSLGAGETTLLRMTTGYAQIVNGGRRITATFIDRIQDRDGKTIFRHDTRPCEGCAVGDSAPPRLPDQREQIIDPITAYQMTSILEGVVQRGTGAAAASLRRPLGGKTGTTNDFTDAWFLGFSPDLVVGTYIGFDQPRTLGRGETGGRNSVPIFKEFVGEALAGKPAVPFRVPPGVRMVRVNRETGQLARPGDSKALMEAFKPGTEPTSDPDNDDQLPVTGGGAGGATSPLGGIY